MLSIPRPSAPFPHLILICLGLVFVQWGFLSKRLYRRELQQTELEQTEFAFEVKSQYLSELPRAKAANSPSVWFSKVMQFSEIDRSKSMISDTSVCNESQTGFGERKAEPELTF